MEEEYRLYSPPNEKALNTLKWIKKKLANPIKSLFEMCFDRDHPLFIIFVDFLQHHSGHFTGKSWWYYYWLGKREPVIVFRRLKRRFTCGVT